MTTLCAHAEHPGVGSNSAEPTGLTTGTGTFCSLALAHSVPRLPLEWSCRRIHPFRVPWRRRYSQLAGTDRFPAVS